MDLSSNVRSFKLYILNRDKNLIIGKSGYCVEFKVLINYRTFCYISREELNILIG
jgi:hypothetical protein